MMNYEMFKEVMAEQIVNYMPEGFQNCTAEIHPVLKVNRMVDGLGLVPSYKELMPKKYANPQIYVNDYYEEYKKCGDLKEVLEMTAQALMDGYRDKIENKADGLLENVKDKLFIQLINMEQNKELLKTLPHRQFQDLAIVYRIAADIAPNEIRSALVDKKLAKKMRMKESDLYDVAILNTKKLFPPTIKSINEVLCELIGDSMPVGMLMGTEEEDIGAIMYVISNEQQVNGASSILYEEELDKLAEKLGTDLYLMPSSIHEAIAISAEIGNLEEIAQMVTDINMSEVKLEERLSNQVYRYDKEQRKIRLATDTPNKRLDRIVAEQPITYGAKQSR